MSNKELFVLLSMNVLDKRLNSLILTILLGTAASAMPYFKQLTTSDGLAHPDVMSVCQDSLGRIWFGTENGLSIYNGNRMVSYRPYDIKGGQVCFKEGLVKKLVCDALGKVFILTSGELVCYNPRTDKMETLLEGDLTALYIDNGQACAVRGQEHFHYDEKNSCMTSTQKLPFSGIRDMLRASDGSLYLICPEGLFRAGKESSFQQLSSLGDLYSLFASSTGEIWTGSNTGGLLRVFPDSSIRHYTTATDKDRGFLSDNIRSVVQDSKGQIWFGTFNGLYTYNPDTDTFRSYYREDREGGLSSSSIHAILKDRDGILWAGTYYGGGNYTDTRAGAFSFFPATQSGEDGLSFPVAGHLMEDDEGYIWICTEGGGLNKLDPVSGKIMSYGTNLFKNAKWLAAYPEQSSLYIATNRQGLFRLDKRSGHISREIVPKDNGSPFYVINVVERYKDLLILSTDDGVWLHSCDSRKDTLLYPRTEGIRYVHGVVSGNKLYLASSTVVEFDLDRKIKIGEYPIVTESGRARPMRLLAHKNGTLYASTFGHGLFRLEDGVFKLIKDSPRDGYQLVDAGDDRILISGDQQIQLLDTDGQILQRYQIGRDLPLQALVLDSGLLLSADGTVYAGGTNGLMSFSLNTQPGTPKDSVYFCDLYVNGEILSAPLPFTEEVIFDGLQKHLDFYLSSRHNITSINWANYEYILHGRDDNWTILDGPILSVAELNVGRYRLEVRHKDTIAPACSIALIIRPHWYATTLAKVLYLLFTLGFLWFLGRSVYIRREAARARQLNETKLRFFTTISHELRSPLTIIIAQIDNIMHTFQLAPQIRSKMGKVRSQAQQMNQLVSELIDFRKFEQNQVTLHLSQTPVNPFVSDIVEKFRELVSSKDLEIHFIPAPDEPKALLDSYQMQKSLMNLVFNAVKFTPHGGSIDLEVENLPSKGLVKIHVRDTGIGIKEEDKERIFERFYQGEGTEGVTEGIPSSGIGLALTKDIVQLHNGQIQAFNRPGGGADFVITLPAYSPASCTQVNEESQETNPKGSKIVIAEDNTEMRTLLKELFSVQYEVFLAEDGAEALELVKKVRPDLVLSDLMMPRMGGGELLAAIKGDQRLSSIPVVLLTALDDTQNRMEGLLKGVDDFIAKPFDSKILLARCNNLVRSKGIKSNGNTRRELYMKATNQEEKDFLERFSSIIDNNISNGDLNIDTLASLMNMSRSRFYSNFKKITSESPAQYINACRLDMSCKLLISQPGMSIADISERLGFNTQNYFCRRFKERYGVSPMQYRRNQE